ncbi:hypothetical protein HBB16_18035 [Pseudonocardia sp. MCCB 268]|nr:hypothetical protein [Pseudonocardia cytotoxica]
MLRSSYVLLRLNRRLQTESTTPGPGAGPARHRDPDPVVDPARPRRPSAEVPGLGPVLFPHRPGLRGPPPARRVAVRDPVGRAPPAFIGTTRRRPPTRPPGASRPPSRPAAAPSNSRSPRICWRTRRRPPRQAPLIADLAAQYARRDQLLAELDSPSPASGSRTALRRRIEVGTAPAASPAAADRPARRDHDYRHGGDTVAGSLGPLCVLHHALKTAGRWRYDNRRRGVHWRSPLGRIYLTRGAVCVPLPTRSPTHLPGPGRATARAADPGPTRDRQATPLSRHPHRRRGSDQAPGRRPGPTGPVRPAPPF